MTRNLRSTFVFSCALFAATMAYAQSGGPTLDAEQATFLTLINNYRAANGVGPLQVSIALQNASQWMSSDLAENSYFSHTDSTGRDPFRRMAAFGYGYAPAGENIAAGNSSAQGTFNQWQGSDGHRANMLNASYKVIGIGRAYNSASPYRWYWTTDFGGYLDQVLGSPPGPTIPRPIISFFGATPYVVTAGQATTLSWSVSGATTISIDNGVGDVSGVTSKSVVPAGTTTYRLTATNTGGSTSAVATATVSAPAGDTQAPSAPAVLWASAATSTQVNLLWTTSTDNVGVIGYQLLRNNLVLMAVPSSVTSYADRTVAGNTSYVYSVRAYDAAGNYSALARSASVTTPGSYTPPAATSIVTAAGSSQVATVATTFAAPLQAKVLNASSQPVTGASVTFSAPTTGASGTFAGNGSIATATTDANGIAKSPSVIANTIAGTYSITASVAGLVPAKFALTNTAAGTPPPTSGATSIWANTTPPRRYMTASGPMELGVKFRSDVSGRIAGIRFYKNPGDGATHKGSLWASDGRLLATGTFTNETASGWQTLTFSSPVAIAANTTYVASYHTSSGVFTVALGYFQTHGADNGSLHALRHGVDGPNGVMLSSTGGKFPSLGSSGHNYWVDVVFVK